MAAAAVARKRSGADSPLAALQLRVGLWSGVVRLENVDLRLEARRAPLPRSRAPKAPQRTPSRLAAPLHAGV